MPMKAKPASNIIPFPREHRARPVNKGRRSRRAAAAPPAKTITVDADLLLAVHEGILVLCSVWPPSDRIRPFVVQLGAHAARLCRPLYGSGAA